ncbi:Remorin like [Actinidia chinensis var. chinensis]|uniref:Remorin like n=1 Tax=Actinidia chinensis var. chinensis TaxID=1590841 RepID=A0A2R6RL53_ACTCC|nr:Remorin like [Actinidia chinensis var. chinensis]
MRKHSLLSRNSGTYTSPGTPDYREGNVGGIQKGWCSERVPLPSNSSRMHISAAALMPFNSGRTLPSKWDDAERWITSPVSGLSISKALLEQPQRRPKSKSGPLGAPGIGCFSNYSPVMPALQGENVRDFMVGSPFTTGVIVPDGLSIQYSCHNATPSNPVHTGNAIARAGSLPGWSDILSESSLPSSQDEKLDGTKDEENMVSHVVARRDMATQMSPRNSARSSASSPKERLPFSTSPPSIHPVVEPHSNHSAKLEIRDVQVDKRATVTKKQGVRNMQNGSRSDKELTSSWDISEAANNMSKLQREEARITAWENLQKAKAEAAIQKLEMKLEKKRTASMDKIMNKVRIAQTKAQEMRNSTPAVSARPTRKGSYKVAFFYKHIKTSLLRGCFTCRA